MTQFSAQQNGSVQYKEVNLIDVLVFLKGAYKSILICGILGFSLAIIYLILTPNRYEAVAQINMAQISFNNISNSNSNSNKNNSISALGVNSEEPALLIVRLASPASFTLEAIKACGHDNHPNAGLAVSNSIKLTIPKGSTNLVELKAFGPTPQEAKECAQAVFELIKTTQAQIAAPYIEDVKVKLADYEERLKNARGMVTKVDKSGQSISIAYLSTRDEIRFLSDEIAALKNQVILNQTLTTRLVAPIYNSETPIAPKKRLVLAVGLCGGLLLGLVLALSRQLVLKLKDAANGVLWS